MHLDLIGTTTTDMAEGPMYKELQEEKAQEATPSVEAVPVAAAAGEGPEDQTQEAKLVPTKPTALLEKTKPTGPLEAIPTTLTTTTPIVSVEPDRSRPYILDILDDD